MEVEDYRQKEKPADAGEDYKPEWETVKEWKTLNSMVPLWQRQKSKVKPEEYNAFYKEKFGDWQDPLTVIHTSAEGAVTYKAMLYIPSHTPYDFYTREYEKGFSFTAPACSSWTSVPTCSLTTSALSGAWWTPRISP